MTNGITSSIYHINNQSRIAVKSMKIWTESQPIFLRENESKKRNKSKVSFQIQNCWCCCLFKTGTRYRLFSHSSNKKLNIGKLNFLTVYSSINGLKMPKLFVFNFLRYRHDQWTESQSIHRVWSKLPWTQWCGLEEINEAHSFDFHNRQWIRETEKVGEGIH